MFVHIRLDSGYGEDNQIATLQDEWTSIHIHTIVHGEQGLSHQMIRPNENVSAA